MKQNFVLGMVLALGILIGAVSPRLLSAQPVPMKPTDLLKADVVDMEGVEVIVTQGGFAPGATSGKHTHPGHEVAYVLEGSAVLEVEGQAPLARKVGTVSYIPAKKVHEIKNGSTTEPMKLLVFRIHPKGQPVTNRLTEPSIMK